MVEVRSHLKPVQAAIRLEDQILGVLQGINIAVLDNKVAQVLCLCRGTVQTRMSQAEVVGGSCLSNTPNFGRGALNANTCITGVKTVASALDHRQMSTGSRLAVPTSYPGDRTSQ